jgi:single stranded DNA-binding protein
MMKSVNKVILVGNLTRDPETKQSEGKHTVCVFGLATNRCWPIKPGETQFETTCHRIVAFDKLAETCAQYSEKAARSMLRDGCNHIPTSARAGSKRQALTWCWKSWCSWTVCERTGRKRQERLRPNSSKSPARNSRRPRMIESFSSLSFMARYTALSRQNLSIFVTILQRVDK